LLPTLALIGLMTFERVLQSGIEDHGYARRISQLRGSYFEQAPQLTDYMPRVPAQERMSAQGLSNGRLQGFLTAAGMVAVVTAVVLGGFAALLCSVLFNHSLAPALTVGVVVAILGLFALTDVRVTGARSSASRKCWRRSPRRDGRPS
jgi:hypothetical protein